MATEVGVGIDREHTFVAVRVVTTVRLPITLPDAEWIPYATHLGDEIQGAIEALKADRVERAADTDPDENIRFTHLELWEH